MSILDASPKLRLGFVGGGVGSQIGPVHRHAATLDGNYDIVAGVLSTTPERNRESARKYGIAGERLYGSYEEMAQKESARPDGIEVVVIVTPSNSHAEISKTFLRHGIHVICDKPMTINLPDAMDVLAATRKANCVYAVTYGFSAYPMIREARARVRGGEIGTVRLVQAEFALGYGTLPVEKTGHKQAVWQTDPKFAGQIGVVGNLGTHIHHLARFITGHEITSIAADLSTSVPDRKIFDNAHIMARFDNGARGVLWASMIAAANAFGLRIRVYGDKGSIEWAHEDSEELQIRPVSGPPLLVRRGEAWTTDACKRVSRIRSYHPEGYLAAFANLYNDVAEVIQARKAGVAPDPHAYDYPSVEDGVLGIAFSEAALESNERGSAWVDTPTSILK
jgi:predicted dehydrogenase